jgi:hypothetical protein
MQLAAMKVSNPELSRVELYSPLALLRQLSQV